MSLIHLVLLAKVVEEQKKRTGARQTSTNKQERKRNDSYESALNAYYNNSSSKENFLEDLLATDKEATKLFLLLKDAQKEIDEEDYKKSLKEVQEIAKKYDEQAQLLQNEIRKLQSNGITLDDSSILTRFYCSVKVKEGQGFGKYGSYSYDPARYLMGFNGMPLTREMLENNVNQFQIDLDSFKKENPDLETKLSEISSKIAKQKRSIKYIPFNKEKKQELLNQMLNLEKEIKEKIEQRTTLERQSQLFSSLTDEQKKAIIAYMNEVANCIVIGEQLSNAIDSSIAIGKDYYGNKSNEERNIHERMLDRAAEKGEFTREEVEAIIDRIKTTMDENEVSISRYKKLSDKPYHHPTSPESMFAATYFDKFYEDKTKIKK